MVSDPGAKTTSPGPRPCSRSCCRCATAGSRCCSGSARSSRSPARWSLPGGELAEGETLEQSIRRHLATKVDVRELAHLEQLETRSDPDRNPLRWELATAYLGLVPERRRPRASRRTRAGTRSTSCRRSRSTTSRSCSPAASACAAKLSYTNIGFALAPDDVHDLRAARPLPRRARPRPLGDEPPARAAAPPPARADRQPPRARAVRRAARRRSTASARRELEITDQFAVLRPPGQLCAEALDELPGAGKRGAAR